jgi:uncharacterized protein YgiM (DUF1202 family)
MKKFFWLAIGMMISTLALADQSTTSSGTNAAAKKSSARRKPVPEFRTVPLTAGPAVVAVGAGAVNVRAKAGLSGEVVARMTNGEPVTVIEEITLKNSKAEEPSAWAKIVLPEKASAWVKSSYIDPANKTVTAKPTLNLRAGPGENYSVVGSLQFGDPVKEIETKGGWTKVETPGNAYAFMAAQYLKQEPIPETTTTITEPPTVGPATNTDMMVGMGMTNEMPTTMENTNVEPVIEEPPPPRIVEHEGIVRGAVSIQAPSHFELISPETRRTINYLYTTSTNLDLNRYKGLRIIVTGEEGLDERWKNTPIITIHRIRVLE